MSILRLSLLLGLCILAIAASSCALADSSNEDPVSPELQSKAIAVLQSAMKDGVEFERIHAAEALLWSGYTDGIEEVFGPQSEQAGPKYRIGVWRVLCQMNAAHGAARREFLQRELSVFLDPAAPDRETAAETLAKLRYCGRDPEIVSMAKSGEGRAQVWARWMLANSGTEADEAGVAELLDSKDSAVRTCAAYALRQLGVLHPTTLDRLRTAAAKEPKNSPARVYILGALFTHLQTAESGDIERELLALVQTGTKDERYQSCMSLANRADAGVVSTMTGLLDHKETDVRVGAAYVILNVGRPQTTIRLNH